MALGRLRRYLYYTSKIKIRAIVRTWSSPKILWKKEQALTGLRIKSRKAALEAPLLAEQVGLNAIGQGIEAELRNSEDATRGSEDVAG